MTIPPAMCWQTLNTDSMLFWCWSSVADAGPTSKQHRVNVLCFLGCSMRKRYLWASQVCMLDDEDNNYMPTTALHMSTVCEATWNTWVFSFSTGNRNSLLKWTKYVHRAKKKWNESGFRPPLCTYRLNWARRTSWGWWDDWDDTVLQTQDSKFEPWRSEAEHATSRSRRLPTILTFTRGWGRNNFVSFKPPRPGTEPRTLAWKAAVLTTTLGPPPCSSSKKHRVVNYLFKN